MGRIIFSIVSLVVLSIVIVMNAGSTTAFNLLGWRVEEVPVVVIAIVSFVGGAIYSFVFYVSHYVARTRKEKLAMQKQRLKSQEQSIRSKDETLKAREKQMTALASAAMEGPRQIPASTGGEPYGRARDERHVGRGQASVASSGPANEPARGRTSSVGRKGRGGGSSGGWLRNLFGKKTGSAK